MLYHLTKTKDVWLVGGIDMPQTTFTTIEAACEVLEGLGVLDEEIDKALTVMYATQTSVAMFEDGKYV